MKTVRKTTRPFRYDVNQIPDDYTQKVTDSRDRSDRVPEELSMEVCNTVQEAVIKTILKKKKCNKAKWLSEKVLEKRRDMKGKGEEERYTHLNVEFQRIVRRDKKAFLSEQWKQTEVNNRMGKTRDLFKKIRDTKGTFHAKMGTIKDRNSKALREAEEIKKRWQEYTELYKKGLNNSYNHDGVVTHLEPDILPGAVRSSGPQEALLQSKLVEVMEFLLNYFKS